MRKYRTMPFRDLINLALNETLSRTILTVSTTTLAVLALLFLGGEVLRGFSIAMLWGIVHRHLLVAVHRGPDPLLRAAEPARDRQGCRAGPTPARRPRAPAKRASRWRRRWNFFRRCRPDARSSSAMRPSGFRVSGAIYLGPVLVFPDRTERLGGARRLPGRRWRRCSRMAASSCCCSASGGAWRRSARHCAAR